MVNATTNDAARYRHYCNITDETWCPAPCNPSSFSKTQRNDDSQQNTECVEMNLQRP